jgi:streptomycin 6-kinase
MVPEMITLPEEFAARARRNDEWARWLAALPRLVEDILAEWQLDRDGPVLTGETAIVLPVLTASGDPAVVKFGLPHRESAYEHLALREWAGEGAVRLLRADPRRGVLLLERADPGHDLSEVPVVEACEVIAALYPRLHRPPIPQLDRLSESAASWAETLVPLREARVVPRRFVDQAIGLATDFASDPATDTAIIHTDLHFFNVLAATREPWLVIDPKPLTGDPAYEVAPLLWNRWAEAGATGNLRAAVLERMFTVVDAAGLDEDRVRCWVVVRELVNVAYVLREPPPEGPASWVTIATTIVKAVQR